MSHTHITAPTQYVEAGGVRHAYRRFGKPGGTPLVFLVHFRGGWTTGTRRSPTGWPRTGK